MLLFRGPSDPLTHWLPVISTPVQWKDSRGRRAGMIAGEGEAGGGMREVFHPLRQREELDGRLWHR